MIWSPHRWSSQLTKASRFILKLKYNSNRVQSICSCFVSRCGYFIPIFIQNKSICKTHFFFSFEYQKKHFQQKVILQSSRGKYSNWKQLELSAERVLCGGSEAFVWDMLCRMLLWYSCDVKSNRSGMWDAIEVIHYIYMASGFRHRLKSFFTWLLGLEVMCFIYRGRAEKGKQMDC